MDNTAKNVQLMDSIKKGRLSLVRFLIADGADVNFVSDKSKTPLQEAEATGNKKMVELLLEMGANCDVRKLSRKKSTVRRKRRSFREIHKIIESAKSNVQKHPVPNSVGETYTKRSGTAAVGEFYETKLLTMALFRLLHDEQIERFYLGSNLDETGAFDDLVLRTSFGGKPHVYCLQAKHRRAGTTVNFNDLCNMQQSKGDFHLSKYFDSYLKIRHLFGPTSEHVMFRGEYEQTELELIIFTPAKLTFQGCKVEHESVAASKIFNTNQSGKAIQIKCLQTLLECFKHCVATAVSEILAKLLLLHDCDTTDLKKAIKNLQNEDLIKKGKFNFASLLQLYGNQQVMAVSNKRFKLLRLRIFEMLEEPLLPSRNEQVEIVNDFLSKLRFYFEQDTEDVLDEVMVREIKSKDYECAEQIYAKSYAAVENWWKQSGQCSFQTKKCDFFRAAVYAVKLEKISLICLSTIKKELIKFRREVIANSKWEVHLRDLVAGKLSFLNIFGITPELTCVKVAQYLQQHTIDFKFIILNGAEMNETLEVLEKAKPHQLVIVYVTVINHDVIPTLGRLVRKLILITKLVYRGGWQFIKDETTSLLDLEPQSQEKVLELPVTFQGSSTALKTLMCDVPRETVDAITLQKLVNGETLEISCINLSRDNEDSSGYYINRDRLINHRNDPKVTTGISDKVVIVAADPGMGKSTFLTGFAKALKKADPSCWIVRINLLNHSQQIYNWSSKKTALSKIDALNFLMEVMSNDKSSIESLERKIFRWYCEQSKLILLIDGFDEISPYYTNVVLQLLKLYKNNFAAKLWVTTRTGGVQKVLEECLKVNAYSLEPFTLQESKQFLRNFLTLKLEVKQDNEKKLQDYIEQLVQQWKHSIDGVTDLISVPLQIKMLAMMFQDDFLFYCNSSDCRMTMKNIYSVELYERFVEQKFNVIMIEEKFKTDISKPHTRQVIEECFQRFITNHQHAAVYALFKQTDVQKYLSEVEINGVYYFLKNVQSSVEKTGIITRVIDGKPIFVHQTYAEYFAAQFICELFFSIQLPSIKKYIDRVLIKFLVKSQQHQIAKFLQELVCIKKHTFPNLVTIARALLKRLLNIASKFYQEPAFRYLLGIVECALRLDADCFVKCKQIVTRKSKSHRSKLLLNASKAGYLGLARLATDKKTIEMRGEAFSPFDFTALYFAASGGHESVVEHLLSNSANANGVSKCDITALHVASEHGNYKIVKLLLDSGADVNFKDHGGLIAMHLAAQRGFNCVVELLLERGSELDRVSEFYWQTALYFASKGGHLEVVRTLIKRGANFNLRSKDGETPLYIATQCGHLNIVRTLLESGSDPNIVTIEGMTPLHLAAKGNFIEIASLLLDFGALIDTASASLNLSCRGCTPLHCAVSGGHLEMVQLLIKMGANVNIATENENLTALHLAAMENSTEIVTLLLESGANIKTSNSQFTPLHMAAKSGFYELVDILLNSGYNVDCKSGSGNRTSLHEACSNGHLNVAKLLLNRGANATLETNGLTPLHMAARKDCSEIIKLLIDSGANINSTIPDDGRTPLHEAAMFKAVNAVITLLDLGANVHLATFDNAYTPVHGAAQSDSAEIIKLLVEHGADINSVTTDDGRTPLHVAVKNESVNAVKILISLGADTKLRANNGSTPLILFDKTLKIKSKHRKASIRSSKRKRLMKRRLF